MMPKENFEKAWKVFTVILGVVIVPLAGWVWNTNVALAQIQNDLTDAEDTILILERKVEEAEENSRAIISIYVCLHVSIS